MSEKETVSGISIDIIKELSGQLQQLYGFASSDIMPIIMHSIAMYSLFSIIATFTAFLATTVYIWKFVIGYTIPKMKKISEESRYDLGEKQFGIWVFNILSAIFIFFCVLNLVRDICYVISPETKLIHKLLLSKL